MYSMFYKYFVGRYLNFCLNKIFFNLIIIIYGVFYLYLYILQRLICYTHISFNICYKIIFVIPFSIKNIIYNILFYNIISD